MMHISIQSNTRGVGSTYPRSVLRFLCVMDNDITETGTFIRNCDCDTSEEIGMQRGANSRASKNVSYKAQLSKTTSANAKEESFPLQKKQVHTEAKQINKNHRCTDIHCLIIFACFIAAWIYIANYAFSQGNLKNVLIPTDSKNVKCGLDSGVRDKKMLFFFNLDKCLDPMTPISGCDTKQICVKSCPQNSFVWHENKMEHAEDLHLLKESLICDSIVDKRSLNSFTEIKKAIENDYCSGWYLKSKSLFNYCIWDFSQNICNILPKILTGRIRRSSAHQPNFIDTTSIKFAEFVENIKSLCLEQNDNFTSSSNMVIINRKLEQSNSNFKRIIAAIIPKFNYNDKEILAEHIAADLKHSWKILIFAFFIHIFAVLLFITLLRWLAAPLVWLSIGGVIIGLTISCIYSLRQYQFWSKEPHVPHHAVHLLAKVQNYLETADVWFYITIILAALLSIILLIVLAIRKRIKIAVAIIKEASKAITNIKSSIFFPIFPGILYILIATLSIIIMLYLSSIGEFTFIMVHRNGSSGNNIEKCICNGPELKPYSLGDDCDPALFEQICHIENDVSKSCVQTSCSFKEIVKGVKTQWFMFFNIFGFFWVTFFISAYEDMVLASTFSMWYWTFNKVNIPKFPLLNAIWTTTVYHMGTLVFGSLILSICRIIRYILELIEKKAKMYNNAITRAIICCMQCFFWILENFLRFLNRNAYIICAIHSTNFCESSKKAFSLITQNILRVYAIDKVSDFLFFLSKILVTGCTSYITYIFLKTYPTVIPIHYPIIPIILVAILAYIMACFIFSTYSMAVDTLFFCFLEDSTENDGTAESPFYMSKELKKLLGKRRIKVNRLQK